MSAGARTPSTEKVRHHGEAMSDHPRGGGLAVEKTAQMARAVNVAEATSQRRGQRRMGHAAGSEPGDLARPDDGADAAGTQDPEHLGQLGVAAAGRACAQRGAGDCDVDRGGLDGEVAESATAHGDIVTPSRSSWRVSRRRRGGAASTAMTERARGAASTVNRPVPQPRSATSAPSRRSWSMTPGLSSSPMMRWSMATCGRSPTTPAG